MQKRFLWILTGVLISFGIISVIGMNRSIEAAKIQEMEQECSDVVPYTSLTEKGEVPTLKYQGVVKSSDELNAGLSKFTDGTFHYYYDSAMNGLKKIEKISDIDFQAQALEKEEILKAADGLLQHAQEESVLENCEKTVQEASDHLSYTIDYTYVKDGERIPAASIIYLYDGTLFSAFFHNLDIINEAIDLTVISKDEAWKLAKDEAESFIKRRVPNKVQNITLEAEELNCERFYAPNYKKHCWICTLSYELEENDPFPFYFEILVDIQTGEIVENANNYT
ncbi:hypothetical protein [Hominifimenecus sp. rT4P-3]|uniref:hypothetical protein n=1 Tax=Hominifimenecus sp. rT4P-3 TaxID=3242979 RepID=UPI003DA40A67